MPGLFVRDGARGSDVQGDLGVEPLFLCVGGKKGSVKVRVCNRGSFLNKTCREENPKHARGIEYPHIARGSLRIPGKEPEH